MYWNSFTCLGRVPEARTVGVGVQLIMVGKTMGTLMGDAGLWKKDRSVHARSCEACACGC